MHTDTEKLTKPIRLVRSLFYLNGVIWLVLGVISLFRLGSGSNAYLITMLVIAILMFGNAAVMVVTGFVLKWPQKRWFWLATAVLIINIILIAARGFIILFFQQRLLLWIVIHLSLAVFIATAATHHVMRIRQIYEMY